jgi:hypothetical protein
MSDENSRPPTFAEAAEDAHNVLCGDREGTFTCHTVDPYVQAMEEAHKREVQDMREEAAQLRATLRGLRKIVRGVPVESLSTPWVTQGAHVYPKKEGADCGDIIATFEDVDGVVGVEAVCVVNAFMAAKEHIDRFFKDKEEADDGPEG